MITAFALVAALEISPGCGGSQNPSEPTTTTTTVLMPPPPGQPPPRVEERAPQERYEGLEVGESAEFENGLILTVEGASLVQEIPVTLREQLEPDDRLVAMRFSVENANPEGQVPSRTFNVTTALWLAYDQGGNTLRTLYPLETSLAAGELPNPNPEYPYLGWQGELRPGQKQQGSMLFAVPPSTTKMRVRFTHPVMGPPPFGEWELGAVSELPQGP